MNSILIDLTQVPRERTGVGIYALNYLRQLRHAHGALRLHLLIQDDDSELLACGQEIPGAVIHRIKASFFRRFVFRVLFEQLVIPLIAIRQSVDAVHSLHYSFPLLTFGRFKRIVTVCDMTFFLFPELHVPVKRIYFRFFIRRLPKVDGLLYISMSTQRDFKTLFPSSRADECVIPLGADLARYAHEPDASVVAALRRRLDVDRFILYLGTIEPRKNIAGLVKAFEQIAHGYPELKLVIAGKPGWHYEPLMDYISASPLRDRIVLTGYINEAEKHALLKSAQLFAYLSFYEGFGLPVLESMAAGVPTIASNVSSIAEVAGDGALQVDPGDVGQIAAAMRVMLDDIPSRQEVARRGLQQSRAFTWEEMTAKSLAFYQRMLARP